MTVYVKDILPIENEKDYTIYFSDCYNRPDKPLIINRKYDFLMCFRPEDGTWIFRGIFEDIKRYGDRYEAELTEKGKKFISRLIIYYPYTIQLPSRVNMEDHYKNFKVKEILDKEYGSQSS